MRKLCISAMMGAAVLLPATPVFAQTTQEELRAALKHRFETITPAIDALLPDIELYDPKGNTVQLRKVVSGGRYTVLVLGCLT